MWYPKNMLRNSTKGLKGFCEQNAFKPLYAFSIILLGHNTARGFRTLFCGLSLGQDIRSILMNGI